MAKKRNSNKAMAHTSQMADREFDEFFSEFLESAEREDDLSDTAVASVVQGLTQSINAAIELTKLIVDVEHKHGKKHDGQSILRTFENSMGSVLKIMGSVS
jgi:hypothetical protein